METLLIPIDWLIEHLKPLFQGIGWLIVLLIASSAVKLIRYKDAMTLIGKVLSASKMFLYAGFVWLALYAHYDPETKKMTFYLVQELTLDRAFVILLAGTEAISNLHATLDID